MNLFVREEGRTSGLPLIFIHGFPFSHAMWQPQVEYFKNKFRIVAYDVRGHGSSPVSDGQYTIEYFVDDLLQLLDELKIKRAVLVGLSMGGYIALRAVERFPERICALVLCDTKSEQDSNQAKINRFRLIKDVKENGSGKFAREFIKTVFAPLTFINNAELIEKIQDIIARNSPFGLAGTMLALASRTDTTSSLVSIKVPTLIMIGEHDALTPPAAGKAMQQRIPRSEFYIIPNAAHLSNLENPQEFNKRLGDFLVKMNPE